MTKIIRCPHCNRKNKFNIEHLDIDFSCDEWDDEWEYEVVCDHCDGEYLLDVEITVAVEPCLKAEEE